MEISKEAYFIRQTTLSEIGKQGQEKLQNAKVLIIGCGGLGSPVAIYLATSGIGVLHLVDFDSVSVSNLHRQVFYKTDDIDKPKAEILASEIKKRAPFTQVTFSNKEVDKNSILELISKFDVVVDATDNLSVKYLINDACVLAQKPLVYGSLYKFDGYVATFNVADNNGNFSCNLRDAFPKIATDIPNCEQVGTLNPIVGIIALMQANEVVKLITKTGKLLVNQLLIYNALENSQLKIKLKYTFTKDKIHKLFENESYQVVSCNFQDENLLISAEELKQNINKFSIINITNNQVIELPFVADINIPYSSFNTDDFSPDFKSNYVVVCGRGITSYSVTLKLKEKYPNLIVLSLKNGIINY